MVCRLVALAGVAFALARAAGANSIASVVVRADGEILFSDYRGNRIWGLGRDGVARVVLADHHTHHLALGPNGTVWGEHVTPDGGTASLWSLDREGRRRELLPPRRRPDTGAYEGTVFTIVGDELVFLRGCQIVRGPVGGDLNVWAGLPCGRTAWDDERVRYGHLHGSLASGPGGTLYFSDGRTIRRISKESAISTLNGRPTGLFAPPLAGEPVFDRVMGLAVDGSGSLYVAERRDRTVREITAGSQRVVMRLPASWTPIGLALANGSVYVLAEPRFPPMRVLMDSERLLRASRAGKIETIACVR
ncbi:MAG TPA: hypothetical protein VGQ75_01630 [Thermoanaerobaculia bacterium]|nr:hypothetical protein [Thermoanaerobaculia bacterium]